MQHSSFLAGHLGTHFAFILLTLNPCSSNVCFSPFGCLFSNVIFCGFPHMWTAGLLHRIVVLCCFHCLPPLDLFISKATRASGPRDWWVEDWSKMNKA